MNSSPLNMKELIENEFVDDPLYLDYLINKELDNSLLFPDFLDQLQPEVEYSTTQVSTLLNKSDAMIRYYMNQLKNYITIIKTSRNYRLRYNQIYKLYLTCLHIDEAGKNINDIKVTLGEELQRVVTESTNYKNENNGLSEEHVEQLIIGLYKDTMETSTNFQDFFMNFVDSRQNEGKLRNKKEELTTAELEYKLLEERIFSLNKLLKQQRALEKEKFKNDSFQGNLNTKFKKGGLFSFLRPTNFVVDQSTQTPDESVSDSKEVQEIKGDLHAIETKKMENEELRKKLKKEVTELEQKRDELDSKILTIAKQNSELLANQNTDNLANLKGLANVMKIAQTPNHETDKVPYEINIEKK